MMTRNNDDANRTADQVTDGGAEIETEFDSGWTIGEREIEAVFQRLPGNLGAC